MQSKHVDFVVCDRARVCPILVIELDDRSHQRDKVQVRDAFIDEVFRSVGLPILRVKAARAYDVLDLRKQIQKAVDLATPQLAILPSQNSSLLPR